MSKLGFALLMAVAGHVALTPTKQVKSDWVFSLQNINYNNTDKNVIDIFLRTVRISPGVYGLNGTVKIKAIFDDKYTAEVRVLRSATGTSRYVLTPYRIPKYSIYWYINNAYKVYVMNDVQQCSNLPIVEDTWNEPVVKNEFYLNQCIITNDNMPLHMQPGYYKLIFVLEGPLVRLVFEVLSKVETLL